MQAAGQIRRRSPFAPEPPQFLVLSAVRCLAREAMGGFSTRRWKTDFEWPLVLGLFGDSKAARSLFAHSAVSFQQVEQGSIAKKFAMASSRLCLDFERMRSGRLLHLRGRLLEAWEAIVTLEVRDEIRLGRSIEWQKTKRRSP